MKALATLISIVVLIIILIAGWLAFDTTLTSIADEGLSSVDLEAKHENSITDFYLFLRTVFSIVFVLAMIGILAKYFLDAFRYEPEEFTTEYDRYGPF